MKLKIAIEPNLTPIKDYLTNKGFDVESVNFNSGTSKVNSNYDAFVVTGLNTNFMGIETTNTKAAVIDAAGLTPEQVYNQLKAKLE